MYKNVIRMGQANQGRKANTFPEIDAMADDSAFFVLQKIGGVRKARQFTKEDFIEQFVGSFVNPIVVTYAELLALSAANNLRVSAWYKITNATAANINLIVQAIATNQIHCDAKDPLYPNDKVMYNFASNVITWRWDTILNISAGQDFRNSIEIQIGADSKNIEIGTECTNITIGSNVVNVKIGNSCNNVNIGNYGQLIYIGDSVGGATFENGNSGVFCANYRVPSFGGFGTILLTQSLGDDLSVEKSILVDRGDGSSFVSYLYNGTFVVDAIAV